MTKKSTKVAKKKFLEVADRYGNGSDDGFKRVYISLNTTGTIP